MVKHSKKIELELYKSICSAFENLTFATVEQETMREIYEVSNVKTLFSSDIAIENSGTDFLMKLIIPKDYLVEIFSTVYPDVQIDGDLGIKDIMAEMTNTIAGHLMLNVESVTGPFKLGLPTVELGKGVDGNPFIMKRYLVDDTYVVVVALYEQ